MQKESMFAAEIALAAREQEGYWDLHFAMMNEPGVLTKDKIRTIAKKEGLDVEKLFATHEAQSYEKVLDETLDIAIDLELTGTPAFIIASTNGEYIEIVPGWAKGQIERHIKEARKAAS